MSKEENPIEKLLNAEDSEPIVLYDEKDEAVRFEQIALIPYEEKLYALLKPMDKMEGVADDEAVIFVVDEDNETGEQFLKVVNEDKIIDDVFKIYLELVEEQEKGEHSDHCCECEDCKKSEKKKAPTKKPAEKKTAKKETKKSDK